MRGDRKGARTRIVVVATRLSPSEAADLDARCGSMSRAEYLRWLLLKDGKRSTDQSR